jgi:uncharacterized tellurite resistance protein B-like protein
MLDMMKRFFGKTDANEKDSGASSEHNIRVATCALFLELACIDEKFTPAETQGILGILKERYGLSTEHANALMAEADREREESVDLWQFANLINQNYTNEEKIEVIETLWEIVYIDSHMNKYERYLMNKLGNLLRLEHRQLIDAKLKAKRALSKYKD